MVHSLPGNVSFSQGAALSVPYGTAYRGLHHKAHARPGETLLVHGASGGVGIAAVQLARAHGMTVIGTAGSQRRGQPRPRPRPPPPPRPPTPPFPPTADGPRGRP